MRFGFNFDPSHLIWQGVDPVEFIRMFPDRIYHVHMKDASVTLNGRSGILTSHLSFGDARPAGFLQRRRGGVRFEEIIRASMRGHPQDMPLSVEWEDCGMAREAGAAEAAQFCKNTDFAPSRPAV
ncbi:MAG: TIM barrel protein [Planctomycetaceae bacterium]